MNKLFINFLLGGFIVSGTSWLGAFASPLIAALFWAYPFSLFPSIFFLQSQGKPNSYISKFLFNNRAHVLRIGFFLFFFIVLFQPCRLSALDPKTAIEKYRELPPGIEGRRLPQELENTLSPLPSNYIRLQVGGDIVLLHGRTRYVLDVVFDVD